MCGKYQCASPQKKSSIPVTVSYHIPSYPIICSTSILSWLPHTNHGSEQGAHGRSVTAWHHPRWMRQGGSPNLGVAAMYWFHRGKPQKKRWKDGEVCHFSRFSKISKHHWFLPPFWSMASLTKNMLFSDSEVQNVQAISRKKQKFYMQNKHFNFWQTARATN